MDGDQDGTKAQGADEQAGEGSQAETPGAKEQEPSVPVVDAETYKAALAERDAQIAELEKTIVEAAKTADAAEKLRAEMDELRAAGDTQRIEFELTLAGARNITAARALLDEHDGDVDKLKAAEPWLFADSPGITSGKTGLEPEGAAGGGTEAELKRWREIAGLDEG